MPKNESRQHFLQNVCVPKKLGLEEMFGFIPGEEEAYHFTLFQRKMNRSIERKVIEENKYKKKFQKLNHVLNHLHCKEKKKDQKIRKQMEWKKTNGYKSIFHNQNREDFDIPTASCSIQDENKNFQLYKKDLERESREMSNKFFNTSSVIKKLRKENTDKMHDFYTAGTSLDLENISSASENESHTTNTQFWVEKYDVIAKKRTSDWISNENQSIEKFQNYSKKNTYNSYSPEYRRYISLKILKDNEHASSWENEISKFEGFVCSSIYTYKETEFANNHRISYNQFDYI